MEGYHLSDGGLPQVGIESEGFAVVNEPDAAAVAVELASHCEHGRLGLG